MENLVKYIGLAPSEDQNYLTRLKTERARVSESLTAFKLRMNAPAKKKGGGGGKKTGMTMKDLNLKLAGLGVTLEQMSAELEAAKQKGGKT